MEFGETVAILTTDVQLRQLCRQLVNCGVRVQFDSTEGATLAILDTPEQKTAGVCSLLAVDREARGNMESRLAQARKAGSSSPLADVDHVVIYDDIGFMMESLARTLARRREIRQGSARAFGVKSLLRMDFAQNGRDHPVYHRQRIATRAGKVQALEDLVTFVEGLRPSISQFSSHFVSCAMEIQEELVANAVCNVNPRLRAVTRTGDFLLNADEQPVLEWGFDGTYLGISVRDSFGSFPEDILGRYRESLFSAGDAARHVISTEGPGAGVGFYMLLERATLVAVALSPGRFADVTALMNVTQGRRG